MIKYSLIIKKLPKFDIRVPEWVMDSLKDAIELYARGFCLASISICDVISEFITLFLLQTCIQPREVGEALSRRLRHFERLQLLKDLKIITMKDYECLGFIRKRRNKYIHLDKIDLSGEDIKKDCLDVLRKLIEFLNRRPLIVLGSPT